MFLLPALSRVTDDVMLRYYVVFPVPPLSNSDFVAGGRDVDDFLPCHCDGGQQFTPGLALLTQSKIGSGVIKPYPFKPLTPLAQCGHTQPSVCNALHAAIIPTPCFTTNKNGHGL